MFARKPGTTNQQIIMGAIKDVYDILADITAKVQTHRLKKGKKRSREELESAVDEMESVVEELRSKIEDLEREHAEEVTNLKTQITHLEQENAALKVKLQTPPPKGLPPIRNFR